MVSSSGGDGSIPFSRNHLTRKSFMLSKVKKIAVDSEYLNLNGSIRRLDTEYMDEKYGEMKNDVSFIIICALYDARSVNVSSRSGA
jgi:hypothetical protein